MFFWYTLLTKVLRLQILHPLPVQQLQRLLGQAYNVANSDWAQSTNTQQQLLQNPYIAQRLSGYTVRPKKKTQNRLSRLLSLNAGQKYCRMLLHKASYHMSLGPLFCLFLSGPFRKVLL